jgi:Fe-coproporphyrin III synthase
MGSYLKLSSLFLRNALFGLKYPFLTSIDVTNKCNLRCKHCYFWKQNNDKEFSENELLERLAAMKQMNPQIIHASWVGGEPLLRKEVVAKGLKLFPFNMVVTNGSIELPNWKNCVFNVSVDGTKEYYEKVRGKIYDLVKKNANRDDISVNVAFTVNRINYPCIEDMLKEWSKTKVRGIIFSFYTPIHGKDDPMVLNWEERDKIIRKIMKLKEKYGKFILNPMPVLNLMLSKNSKKVTANCIVPKAVVCIDPVGKRKLPCVIGKDADCSRCGCVIAPFLNSVVVKKDWRTLSALGRVFT